MNNIWSKVRQSVLDRCLTSEGVQEIIALSQILQEIYDGESIKDHLKDLAKYPEGSEGSINYRMKLDSLRYYFKNHSKK